MIQNSTKEEENQKVKNVTLKIEQVIWACITCIYKVNVKGTHEYFSGLLIDLVSVNFEGELHLLENGLHVSKVGVETLLLH